MQAKPTKLDKVAQQDDDSMDPRDALEDMASTTNMTGQKTATDTSTDAGTDVKDKDPNKAGCSNGSYQATLQQILHRIKLAKQGR